MIERIYTKECYERIKKKFYAVDTIAQTIIDNAQPDEILELTISMDGMRVVRKAKVVTPEEYLESCLT